MVAAEALADAHARQGRAADDVALLEELAARDPLRESVTVQLVRALYAANRQADALAAYDRCRGALADELGVEPTPALRQVRAAVLAHDPLPGVGGTVLPTHLPPRNRSFVGRRGLLAAVDATLDDDTRRPRAVALTGLGGVGKTELALELAHQRHRHGRVAWWISAEDPAGTATGLAALATALGIAPFERREDARAALWAELDRTPGWLLVYDNADEPAQLEPFLPAARHGDVIITSRNPAWRRIAHPVAVGPLARGESLAYVATRTGDRPVEADTLAELLGDLPLALEQACAYIEQTRMSLPDYVDLFRRHRDGLLLRDVEGSGRTVATTWGLAFDRLAARSPRGADLLETIAFLAPDAISVATLGRFERDELGLQEALRELLRLSLVDRETDKVRVHRLVQDVVRARMSAATRRDRLGTVAQACVAQAAEAGRDVPDDLAAHLVVLAGHAEALGAEPDGLVEALESVARRQAERALYPAAEHVLRAALRLHAPNRRPRRPRAPDLRARAGARCRGPARAGAGPAPSGGRAPGGDGAPGRRRARARPQPARPRAQLRGRRPCRDHRAPARARRPAPGRPRGPGAGGADRPGLHAVGQPVPSRRPGRRSGRASPCWRSRAVATNAAGRTPPPGSAWSSRTWAGWTRRWPTSGRRSRRSSGSVARTTPTPPRRSTSSATPCGCRAGSTRPSRRTGAASACSNACSGRTTRASGWR